MVRTRTSPSVTTSNRSASPVCSDLVGPSLRPATRTHVHFVTKIDQVLELHRRTFLSVAQRARSVARVPASDNRLPPCCLRAVAAVRPLEVLSYIEEALPRSWILLEQPPGNRVGGEPSRDTARVIQDREGSDRPDRRNAPTQDIVCRRSRHSIPRQRIIP